MYLKLINNKATSAGYMLSSEGDKLDMRSSIPRDHNDLQNRDIVEDLNEGDQMQLPF